MIPLVLFFVSCHSGFCPRFVFSAGCGIFCRVFFLLVLSGLPSSLYWLGIMARSGLDPTLLLFVSCLAQHPLDIASGLFRPVLAGSRLFRLGLWLAVTWPCIAPAGYITYCYLPYGLD